MKNIVLILFLIVATFGCKINREENPVINFTPDSKSIVRLNLSNCKSNSYSVIYNTLIPFNQYVKHFTVNSDTLIELEIKSGFPTEVHLIQEKGFVDFLALPNDTIEVFVNHNDSLEFSQMVTYKGKTAAMSDFLSKEKLRLQRNFPSEIETPDAYNTRIDSIVVIAKKKLYNFINKEKLPEWFIKYEENDIYFFGEYLKLYQFKQRYWFYNQIIKRDLKISGNLRNQLDNNEFFTQNYLLFLDQIHSDKHDTLASPKYATNRNFLNYIHDNIDLVNETAINSKMKSCFIASKLSTSLLDQKILRMSRNEFLQYSTSVDSLYEIYCSSIADSSILACITEYKTTQFQKIQNRNPLMKCDKAPDFYLTDINGKFHALKDFQGKLIYLSFWATWCFPCIKTLPDKNAIIRKYENKQIEFINISFDTEKDKWEKSIKDYNILGLNLICKGNWEDNLKTKYYIQGLPKYVLINKNGEVIDSDAPSPGNKTELTSLIDKYLN